MKTAKFCLPRAAIWFLIAVVFLLADPLPAQPGPPRGLNTLPGRQLNVAYINALRRASGTTAQKIAQLNYDSVDVFALAFAQVQTDASLNLNNSNFGVYHPHLVPQAHAHSRSVLMSLNEVSGGFETVSADAILRQRLATNIADTLQALNLDGVDFDWEWPNTTTERANFTALMQSVYATVKSRSTNYIVMFVQGPGYWLAGTDWQAVRNYSDFCFCIAYDWNNPANGPIRKPGAVQFLGLGGGSIEAAAKGAIDYIIGQGYPANQLIVGFPFYSSTSSTGRSWFYGSTNWLANRIALLGAMDPNSLEVEYNGAWWTTPDCLKRKMDALLDPRFSVLNGRQVVRGVGSWELGHEDLSQPHLSTAMKEWRDGDRSVGGLASAPPTNTTVLIDTDATWRYYDSTAAPGAAWASRTFNDSAWLMGTAPLGFGDGDESTTINSSNGRITTYFRRAFTVSSPAQVRSLTVRLLRDDGAIVYLNGTEVFRSNMPTGTVNSTTSASSAVGVLDEASLFHSSFLSPALLITGTNVIAVEVHQAGTASSDLSFNLQLLAHTQPASFVLIPAHSTWRYLDTVTNPPAWTDLNFDDRNWFSGLGRLGYGTDGEATQLLFGTNAAAKPMTCYFRHTFTVADPSLFGALQLHLQRDDGAVIYLNGAEIHRSNMPTGTVAFATPANASVAGTDETNWFAATLPAFDLVAGTNVIAVEVHQAAPNSSDLGLDVQLTGILTPPLFAERNGNLVRLRWPANAHGFRLWQTSDLTSPSPIIWQRVSGTPTITGPWLELSVTASGPTSFYRLSTE